MEILKSVLEKSIQLWMRVIISEVNGSLMLHLITEIILPTGTAVSSLGEQKSGESKVYTMTYTNLID